MFVRPAAKALLCPLVALLLVARGTPSQTLDSIDMDNVTAALSERFEEFRVYGLGAEDLEAEYKRVGFTFSSLEEMAVDAMLDNQTARETIRSVFTLFDEIADLNFDTSASFTTLPTTECCSIAQSASSQACCHFCNATTEPVDSVLLDNVARTFRDASLEGVEFELGLSNGAILTYPLQETTDCRQLDARIQSWYIDTARAKPREVVLLLDLALYGMTLPVGPIDLQPLREAAREVLASLTPQDKVGVVAVGSQVYVSSVNSQQVVPSCPELKDRLSNDISQVVATDGAGKYTDGFSTALGLFTDDSSTDKLLLFFTVGFPLYSDIEFPSYVAPDNVVISVYRTKEQPLGDTLLQALVLQPGGNGVVTTLGFPGDTSGYYSVFPASMSPEPVISHQFDSQGADSLSISQVLYNGSSLVGVLHAVLPWKQVFVHISSQLEKRASSYFFVVGESGRVLSHPLFPGNSNQSEVSITELEKEANVTAALAVLKDNSTYSNTTQNVILLPTVSSGRRHYIQREVTSTYYWKNLNISDVDIYVCIVLAAEDVTTVTLSTLDPQAVYSGNSSRQPLYHDLAETVNAVDQCNYFCKISTTDQISFQLTGTSEPPTEDTPSLVQAVTEFIEGAGPRPDWADSEVAVEVVVNSVVTSAWLNQEQEIGDYITRRHIATPAGVYLTYPPAHLSHTFLPVNTDWFSLSASHRSLLTLTPPRVDALMEGGLVFSLGYALRAPDSMGDTDLSDGGQLLSVVAADVKLAQLEVILAQTLPLCRDSRFSCFIVDDRGILIYHASFLDTYTGDPVFLSSLEENRVILIRLLEGGLATKRQCQDHFSEEVKSRLFYTLDLSLDPIRDDCPKFVLQRIPDTNTFLGVHQLDSTCDLGICANVEVCLFCERAVPFGCEAPCYCVEDCLTSTEFPACPPMKEGSNLDVADGDVVGSQSFCFNQNCSCRNDFDSCSGARECKWCEQQNNCVHIAECCRSDANRACCTTDEFTHLPHCIAVNCASETNIPTCPTLATPVSEENDDNDDTAIFAGVAGAIVGVALVSLLIVFIVWYQCCRTETDEDASKGSAFDFTKGRVDASNPASTSPDIEKQAIPMEGMNTDEATKHGDSTAL